ncbi:hypothetical protein SNOG_06652 [Parastagonospora nodorum SN15]|uniref:Uncharacterized protein n=1 Tax=Phaeosphaeria nodorum (strain SN15 / ATCC MYA-4574 / FGSC 10173) TaxID=321614 RepID=Q0UNL2_PHANO|nr:hypothetical protein SNOG_06652 [Parastagonospora nodorum SN15]EAT86483.1 hypothetical protein SNOG_06652 [Parastagonospora nodorum SN15]
MLRFNLEQFDLSMMQSFRTICGVKTTGKFALIRCTAYVPHRAMLCTSVSTKADDEDEQRIDTISRRTMQS